MDAGPDEFGDGEVPAADAFAILGNELRLRTLWALWEAEEPYLSFAELRRQVAPEDTGNFNYHLGKLTDHFVRKTDDGYALRVAGEHVVRAVLSGTITAHPALPAAEIDERCVYCGSPVEMEYGDEFISVRCTECGGVVSRNFPDGTYMNYGFPPAGLAGRSREEAVDAAHVLYDSKVTPMIKGVCPECAGKVSTSFEICHDHEPGEDGLCPACETRYSVWSIFRCSHCSYTRQSAMWFAAVTHPAVIAFLYDHGLDESVPFRKLTWDNAKFVRNITERVVETDPYRFQVTVPVDAETLVVQVNDELDVIETERTVVEPDYPE